jgi:hypothetical protein
MEIKTIAITVTKQEETLAIYADITPQDDINDCYIRLREKAYKLLNKSPYQHNDSDSTTTKPNFRGAR